MYTYIFIYDSETADREVMKSHLDAMPEVLSWRYDTPNSFFVYSNETANQLTIVLANRLMGHKCFLFSEISSNRQGYLKKDTWNFINQNSSN